MKWLIRILGVGLLFCSLGISTLVFTTAYQKLIPAANIKLDPDQESLIVVLGAGHGKDKILPLSGKQRANLLLELIKQQDLQPSYLILSGGYSSPKLQQLYPSEAKSYLNYLASLNLELFNSKILLEETSSNTFTNAYNVAQLILNYKFTGQIVVITSSFHLVRAYQLFKYNFINLGLDPQQLKMIGVDPLVELNITQHYELFFPSYQAVKQNFRLLLEVIKYFYNYLRYKKI